MNFQYAVITIVILLLIISLILIGIALAKSKNTQQWPPVVGNCPDYWTDLSSNGAQCVNVKDLGTCNASISSGQHLQMNFSVAPLLMRRTSSCVSSMPSSSSPLW